MRAAPLSEVKKTNVSSAILRSRRRLRIFPTLSSISRTASPYLRGEKASVSREVMTAGTDSTPDGLASEERERRSPVPRVNPGRDTPHRRSLLHADRAGRQLRGSTGAAIPSREGNRDRMASAPSLEPIKLSRTLQVGVHVSRTKDSPPSPAGAQEGPRRIHGRVSGVDGPVQEEGAPSRVLPLHEVQRFLGEMLPYSSARRPGSPVRPPSPRVRHLRVHLCQVGFPGLQIDREFLIVSESNTDPDKNPPPGSQASLLSLMSQAGTAPFTEGGKRGPCASMTQRRVPLRRPRAG